MPISIHVERHFTSGEFVRDIVIGMSDGLAVPFALAAGPLRCCRFHSRGDYSGVGGDFSRVDRYGARWVARGDAEHYEIELKREEQEIVQVPEQERNEVARVLEKYGLTKSEIQPIVTALSTRPQAWVDFMMRFELELEQPDPAAH